MASTLHARTTAAILMLLVAGCETQPKPDLVRLYAPVAAQPKTHPLIVIPGVMGSRLRRADNDRELWPGWFWNLMFASDFDDVALTIPGSEVIAGAPQHPGNVSAAAASGSHVDDRHPGTAVGPRII